MQYGHRFVREHDTLVQKVTISFLFSVRLFVEGDRLTHIGSCVTFTFKVKCRCSNGQICMYVSCRRQIPGTLSQSSFPPLIASEEEYAWTITIINLSLIHI